MKRPIEFVVDIWGQREGLIYEPNLTSDFEKELIFDQCKKSPPGDALVIGCLYGADLYILARTWQLIGREGHIWGIDSWDPGYLVFANENAEWKVAGCESPMAYVKSRLAKYGIEDRVSLIQSDSLAVQWDKDVGFLIIDGDHGYFHANSELIKYTKHVKPGGIIMMHDYEPNFPGVVDAVNEWHIEHPDWPFYVVGRFAIFRKPGGK